MSSIAENFRSQYPDMTFDMLLADPSTLHAFIIALSQSNNEIDRQLYEAIKGYDTMSGNAFVIHQDMKDAMTAQQEAYKNVTNNQGAETPTEVEGIDFIYIDGHKTYRSDYWTRTPDTFNPAIIDNPQNIIPIVDLTPQEIVWIDESIDRNNNNENYTPVIIAPSTTETNTTTDTAREQIKSGAGTYYLLPIPLFQKLHKFRDRFVSRKLHKRLHPLI